MDLRLLSQGQGFKKKTREFWDGKKVRVKKPDALYINAPPCIVQKFTPNSRKGLSRSSILTGDTRARWETAAPKNLCTKCGFDVENRPSSYRKRNQLKFPSRTKTWCSNSLASVKWPDKYMLNSWMKSLLPRNGVWHKDWKSKWTLSQNAVFINDRSFQILI